MLPRDYPPLDPRLMGHEELTPWLLPHSGDKPLVPYKDRGAIHPSILAQMAQRLGRCTAAVVSAPAARLPGSRP